MRIVALADTHTFEGSYGRVPGGDVLIHAGDFCRGGRLEELRPAAEWLRPLPHRHKVAIAGNHDWCFVRTPEPRASYSARRSSTSRTPRR